MLLKLSQAIEQMNIWPVRKIQNEFQREADRLDRHSDAFKEEKCGLDQLLNYADKLFEKDTMVKSRNGRLFESDDLNEHIAKLEARIAELEAEEDAAEKVTNTAKSEKTDKAPPPGFGKKRFAIPMDKRLYTPP